MKFPIPEKGSVTGSYLNIWVDAEFIQYFDLQKLIPVN